MARRPGAAGRRRERLDLTAALAEHTPQWAGEPWTLTVREDPGRYPDDRPCWEAHLTLAPQFAAITYPLGTHNMTLDRAISTATGHLETTWQLGDWTRTGLTASCPAHRKTPAHAQ